MELFRTFNRPPQVPVRSSDRVVRNSRPRSTNQPPPSSSPTTRGEESGGVQTGSIVYKINRAHGLQVKGIGKEVLADALGATSAMDQRVQFIADWLSGDYLKVELCAIYSISRPTADKWIRRYEQGGAKALEERSRAAHSHPNQTPEEVREMLILTKLSRKSWGPKKVVDYLSRREPKMAWPADSTVGEIFKRAGLVKRRRTHRHVSPYSEPFAACQAPNQSWSADFKGDFLLGNGRRCYPLTLSDNFSRYLLVCRALEHPSYPAVRPWFERAFREYGLPYAIRTDNGAPFASLALGGISELSKWVDQAWHPPGAD